MTPTVDGVTLTNNVLVASDQPDPDSADNTASETTDVGAGGIAQVDLGVIKTDSPDPVVVGSTLTYTLTVRNAGPDAADNVTLTDRLPSSVTFGSVTPAADCTHSGGTVTCDLGTLAAGTTETVEITVTPTTTTTLDDFAQVSADQEDVNPADNSDREETTVVSQAPADQVDLVLTKTDSTDPVNAGTDFSYTLQITNTGSTGATGVTLVDNLPPAVTFVSASAGCTHSGGTVTCDLGTLGAGLMTSVTITVTAPGTNASLTNSASVSADQPDLTPADNSATEGTTVQTVNGTPPGQADLAITKTDSPDPVPVGQLLTYTLTVSNAGPDPATGVTVTDNLSSRVAFAGATVSPSGTCSHDGAATGGTVTCDVGGLAVGATATVTLTVTALTAGTADDFAAVSGNETDDFTDDNTTTERTTIGVPDGVTPTADLALMKSASPDPVTVGAVLTYSLTATNAGPDPATGVVVSDTLPGSVACLNASSPDTPAGGLCGCPADAIGGTVTCELGSLGVGASAILTIQVRPTVAETLFNQASVSADQAEPAFADNVADSTTTVGEAPGILPIPTLGEWGMILLGLLLGTGGLWVLRRR